MFLQVLEAACSGSCHGPSWLVCGAAVLCFCCCWLLFPVAAQPIPADISWNFAVVSLEGFLSGWYCLDSLQEAGATVFKQLQLTAAVLCYCCCRPVCAQHAEITHACC